MGVLSLTGEERRRFALWLENEAVTEQALLDQLEKFGSIPAFLVTQRKAEIAAHLLVARKLRSIEDASI